MDSFLGVAQNSLNSLNNSKFFAGIVMLMLNLGARFYRVSLSKTQEDFLRYNLARELIIFAMAWVSTRDIITSILITAAFVVLTDYLLNEDSCACVIPKRALDKQHMMRSRMEETGGRVTKEEERKAIETLEKARKQKEMESQVLFSSKLAKYQHDLE